MRPVARTLLSVLVAALALVAGVTGGWYLHAPGSAGTGPSSTTLSLIAAGTLAPILPGLASRFAAETSGVSAAAAAQLYEGSTAAASAITLPGEPYDLFVAADFRVIPQHLEPPAAAAASWEVVFASDPLVLAYSNTTPGLAGIDSTNWYEKVVGPGIVLGAPNASADPLGANVIFSLELTDELAGLNGNLYGHFFTGPFGGFAEPTTATRIVAENVAATALATGEVSAYLIYRSYAVANRLPYVALNGSVDLGGTTATDVARYATVNTTVLAGSSTAVLKGAPVLFALTVPSAAPNPPLGIAFAAFLMSNATATVWAADGFVPLAPLWTDTLPALPGALSGTAPGEVMELPPYLAAELP